jgi:hypothetical protein
MEWKSRLSEADARGCLPDRRCALCAVEEDGENYYAATVCPAPPGSTWALGSRSDGRKTTYSFVLLLTRTRLLRTVYILQLWQWPVCNTGDFRGIDHTTQFEFDSSVVGQQQD